MVAMLAFFACQHAQAVVASETAGGARARRVRAGVLRKCASFQNP